MVAFLESPRFGVDIRYGTAGGVEFNTDITTVASGVEYRNVNWVDSRGRWEFTNDVYNRAEIDQLIAFFRSRMGRAGGFRFKDWSDYQVSDNLVYIEGAFETTEDETSFQMVKRYQSGDSTTYRTIRKPVAGTLKFYLDDILLTGEDIPDVDYTTGIITYATAEGLRWTGEFDIPARFDVDRFNAVFEAYRDSDKEALFTVNGLTIVELRDE